MGRRSSKNTSNSIRGITPRRIHELYDLGGGGDRLGPVTLPGPEAPSRQHNGHLQQDDKRENESSTNRRGSRRSLISGRGYLMLHGGDDQVRLEASEPHVCRRRKQLRAGRVSQDAAFQAIDNHLAKCSADRGRLVVVQPFRAARAGSENRSREVAAVVRIGQFPKRAVQCPGPAGVKVPQPPGGPAVDVARISGRGGRHPASLVHLSSGRHRNCLLTTVVRRLWVRSGRLLCKCRRASRAAEQAGRP